MKEKRKIFKPAILAMLACIAVGLVYVQKGDQPKSSFNKIKGSVIFVNNTNENYPRKDPSKFRYIQIDNYSKPFEVFIGKGAGDFKPAFENINSLKTGDTATIYFEENNKTAIAPVNNFAYFIDKGELW